MHAHPTYKNTVRTTENLLVVIFLGGLLVPIFFAGFFLQSVNPLHRFFVEVLEYKPELNLQTMPIIIFLMWSVLQCSNTIVLILMITLLYLKFYYFWVSSMIPITLISGGKYVTQLGYMSGANMIRFYRLNQVLSRMFNQFLANRMVAGHQAVIQVILVLSSFSCIRYFELIIHTPGLYILYFAIILSVTLHYMESNLLGDTLMNSRRLKSRVKNLTKRSNIVHKAVASTWDLKVDIVHPYFTIGRHTFLQFMNSSLSFTVDVLVAAG